MTLRKSIVRFCLSFALVAPAAVAQIPEPAHPLRLLPTPKEVKLAEGKIVIRRSTTILISNAEDRLAAETLQGEIKDRSGLTLAVANATSAPKSSGNISLGRLTDRGLQGYLESQGIKTGEDLGDQGYVIRVSDTGIIVASRTSQGLFYGVQTLRQL